MRRLRELAKENIERVEWTLQDKDWQPTRDYVRKLLASYRELAQAIGVSLDPWVNR